MQPLSVFFAFVEKRPASVVKRLSREAADSVGLLEVSDSLLFCFRYFAFKKCEK